MWSWKESVKGIRWWCLQCYQSKWIEFEMKQELSERQRVKEQKMKKQNIQLAHGPKCNKRANEANKREMTGGNICTYTCIDTEIQTHTFIHIYKYVCSLFSYVSFRVFRWLNTNLDFIAHVCVSFMNICVLKFIFNFCEWARERPRAFFERVSLNVDSICKRNFIDWWFSFYSEFLLLIHTFLF